MNQADKLLKRLARDPVWTWAFPETEKIVCSFCGAKFDDDETIRDECLHNDDCLWRLAVEYIQGGQHAVSRHYS